MYRYQEHRIPASECKALGNECRIRIMRKLEKGQMCLRDIAADLGMRPRNASKHVRQLRLAGFIQGSRDGQFVYFRRTAKSKRSRLLKRVLRKGIL